MQVGRLGRAPTWSACRRTRGCCDSASWHKLALADCYLERGRKWPMHLPGITFAGVTRVVGGLDHLERQLGAYLISEVPDLTLLIAQRLRATTRRLQCSRRGRSQVVASRQT